MSPSRSVTHALSAHSSLSDFSISLPVPDLFQPPFQIPSQLKKPETATSTSSNQYQQKQSTSLALPTMETFSLLKYWRGGGSTTNTTTTTTSPSTPTTTISTSALSPTVSSSLSDSDEEGSFFDLEFSVQEESDLATLSSHADVDLLRSEPVSPSGDLFLNSNSIIISSSDPDTKPLNQFPVSLLKSATKVRVFLLGLKKSRSTSTDQPGSAVLSTKPKFLVVSLFSRDSGVKQNKSSKEEAVVSAEERKFAKEVVLKYLNKIRPLYVRVSKRYGEKLRFATSEGEETDAETEVAVVAPTPVPVKATPVPKETVIVEPDTAAHPVVVACGVRAPRASVPAGIKEVYKRLGKSRSASATVAAKAAVSEIPPPQRRDDSLIQQQDGIQSAIAHCKRSFNSSSIGSESPLQRSMSDPGDGRLDTAVGDGA
ncbi:membrane-associated kinase regulator [Rhynchospora pubera]|uniref:Membrane-associated kinase regulator n=1 Tax=Rhynchospora pubera TaxID=906938 RepID=A0AAV8CAR2_9POAL|nr:membrane-associated kinase regulator [Rhynchospora pubera]